ncbi:hypothetical protein CSUB01_07911 [Colletotrichum sublineola]|uniref:DUF4238 domain-containing protein n=1 Tax=Colletotrichum sublineola TaxID=1173701 RepID=A0A066Y239_COLSU|nr:hypothetical protein CSUB01_07911 [Colletotrichum sublineola]
MQPQVQYQHYIPQFILRNFSHPYKPLGGKRARNRHKSEPGRLRRGENVLNVVHLASEEPQIREAPVSRWFGRVNMYEDAADAIKGQKQIEDKLGRLESQSAIVIQRIKKAHERGQTHVRLERREKDQLRKFLFIMKYRGPRFHDKYLSGDEKIYQWEDKNLLRAYMAQKGFRDPREVWLDNLSAILDLDMDAEGEWVEKLPTLMFPPDATMFMIHVQHSYMAFCTPSDKNVEFILTDQVYNIFEGPTCESYSVETRENLGSLYLCFHEFGPISGRLIIVLRSSLLPQSLEDADPKTKMDRERILAAAAAQFPNAKDVKSILADLPVSKATNSCVRVVNGRLETAPGYAGKARRNDLFDFRFWQLNTSHVHTINSIFLDNIHSCNSIVFRTKPSFQRTLEAYMTTNSGDFKNIGGRQRGAPFSRYESFQKLSIVLKALGSDKVPRWHDDRQSNQTSYIQSIDDMWLNIMVSCFEKGSDDTLVSGKTDFWNTYRILDGTTDKFVEDLKQSWKLYRLHSVVFYHSRILEDELWQRTINNVCRFMVQFHPRRIWLFVKHMRWMFSDEYAALQQNYIGTGPILAAKTTALLKSEIEDSIARGKFGNCRRSMVRTNY